ncbi:MAG TPA: hypothetical protein VFU21_17275 [Kofleriaceae bacterium]|nr:hypothetical protein [Kofleriaceae bacterium]
MGHRLRLWVCLLAVAGCGDEAGEPAGDGGTSDQPGEGDAGVDGAGDCEVEPTEYVGNQYDRGGARSPIDGTVPAVDAVAGEIAARAAQTVAEVEAARARLPYGDIDPDPAAAPQLTVYPAPDGLTASNQYRVTVEQDGGADDSFVYRILARKPDSNREVDTSWTSFSFAGQVTVKVRKLAGAATGCLVRPRAAGVETSFAGGVCTFTLTRPGNLSVEFEPDIHNPIEHPMLVFANPPEVDVPDPTDPDVLYLGPGVHQLGTGVPIESGKTIYIAGGAWVNGAFVAAGPVEDVTIKGRGVISGLFMDTGDQDDNKDQPGIIDIPYRESENILIEGITTVDAPRFNIRALATHTTIHNVKTMSWWFSTDGLVAGRASVIEDSFTKVNDDSIKLHWGDLVVRRNVLWQLENGGTFNLSWNIADDVHTFHIYDNDVIHAEHHELDAQAIFRSRHAGSGHLHRYLFEDIRIENATFRLFYLVLENNKWFDPELGYGRISQLVFRNIHAATRFQQPNVIQGIDATHDVHDVSLQDVFTSGACLGSREAGDFSIDPTSTDAVRIMRNKDGSCWTATCTPSRR